MQFNCDMDENEGTTFIYKLNQNYKKEFFNQSAENLVAIYDDNANETRLTTIQHVTETVTEQNNEKEIKEVEKNDESTEKELLFDSDKPKFQLKSCSD